MTEDQVPLYESRDSFHLALSVLWLKIGRKSDLVLGRCRDL